MTDLIKRLEGAESGSRELDLAFERKMNTSSIHDDHLDRFPDAAEPYTTSLDAIVALIGEKLPDVDWSVERDSNRSVAWVGATREWANTPALALCIALLRISQGGENADG